MTEPLSRNMRTSPVAATARSAEGVHGADPPAYSDATVTGAVPDHESPPSTPRWVKAIGIGAVVLVLLLAGLHLTGNTPSHMPGGTEHSTQSP